MPAQRKYPKYPEELRERAVRMVFEIRDRDGKGWAKAAMGAQPLISIGILGLVIARAVNIFA
jgi:hypothetical protein